MPARDDVLHGVAQREDRIDLRGRVRAGSADHVSRICGERTVVEPCGSCIRASRPVAAPRISFGHQPRASDGQQLCLAVVGRSPAAARAQDPLPHASSGSCRSSAPGAAVGLPAEEVSNPKVTVRVSLESTALTSRTSEGSRLSGMSVLPFVSIVFASEPKLRIARAGSSWSAIALRKQRCRVIRV